MLRSIVPFLATILLAASAHAVQAPAPDPLQGDGRVSSFYTWQGEITATPGKLLRQEKLEPTLGLASAGTDLRILYSSMNGVDGKTPVAVSGLLFLPKGEPPHAAWPLLAWAHGTVGMADICAPSWAGLPLRVEAVLNAWLDHGFAIVATDYQGLGTPGPHPYLAVRPAAYDVLDSVRAVQQAFPAIGKKIVLAGYSQGAGPVLGAGAFQASYAPGLDIRGIVASGVPYITPEPATTMRQDTANQVSYTLMYPLYIGLMAQQSNPTLKASDMFTEKALPLFELTRRACTWQLALEVLGSGLTRAESVKEGYARALMANMFLLETPSPKLSEPVFIGIGEDDTDAPTRLQLELVKRACAEGTIVEAHLYAGLTHYQTLTRSVPGAISFAERVLSGKTIKPACAPEAE
jgi:acetyl esterase/lipase